MKRIANEQGGIIMSEEKDGKNVISEAIADYDKRHENNDIGKISTDRTSKKLQTDHIKMKADELTQGDFSNENCCDDCVDSNANGMGFIEKNELSPTRYLEQIDIRISGILQDLKDAHDEYMDKKYVLYDARSEIYTTPGIRDKLKKDFGNNSDATMKEYVRNQLSKELKEREEAEFKYEQCLRVFESLK